jgi:hypothetical protein
MGALRGEADDLRGVVDTVVPEPPVNTKMSINRQGNAGINNQTIELTTSNSGDCIPRDNCKAKQTTFLEWLIRWHRRLQTPAINTISANKQGDAGYNF